MYRLVYKVGELEFDVKCESAHLVDFLKQLFRGCSRNPGKLVIISIQLMEV